MWYNVFKNVTNGELSLNTILTGYRQCAGGDGGSYGVGSYTFIYSSIPPSGLWDGEKLSSIRMGDQADSVSHLQCFPIWNEHAFQRQVL